jgi:hypothetical protein
LWPLSGDFKRVTEGAFHFKIKSLDAKMQGRYSTKPLVNSLHLSRRQNSSFSNFWFANEEQSCMCVYSNQKERKNLLQQTLFVRQQRKKNKVFKTKHNHHPAKEETASAGEHTEKFLPFSEKDRNRHSIQRTSSSRRRENKLS